MEYSVRAQDGNRYRNFMVVSLCVTWSVLMIDVLGNRHGMETNSISFHVLAACNVIALAGSISGCIGYFAWQNSKEQGEIATSQILAGLLFATVVIAFLIACPALLLGLTGGIRD